MTAETKPANVVEALARVTAELGGIEKLTPQQRGKTGEAGVSYAYRGVDQIAAAAQPLLGKYGVVIVPEVQFQQVHDLTVNGKPWTDTAVEVIWHLYGPGGVSDKLEAVTRGLGRDNSDKGPNKALTQAYKNLLLRLLCIGDPADDTDGSTHEADVQAPSEPRASEGDHIAIRNLQASLDPEQRKLLVAWWNEQHLPNIKTQDALTQTQADRVFDWFDALQGSAGGEPGGPSPVAPAEAATPPPVEEPPADDSEPEALRALHEQGLLHPDEVDNVKTGGGPHDARLALEGATQRRGNR